MGGVWKTCGFLLPLLDGSADLGMKPSLALGRDNWFAEIQWSGIAVIPLKVLHYQDARTQHYHRAQDAAFFLTISRGAFLSTSRSLGVL